MPTETNSKKILMAAIFYDAFAAEGHELSIGMAPRPAKCYRASLISS